MSRLCTQHTQTYNRPVNILTFYSSAPVSHDCATVSQRLETGADKWSSAIIHFIIYTSAFPSGTCQNVLCEKGPLTVTDSFMLMWFIWYVSAVKQMINNEFSHKMSVGKQSSSSSYTPLILTLFPYSSSFVSVTYFVSLLSSPSSRSICGWLVESDGSKMRTRGLLCIFICPSVPSFTGAARCGPSLSLLSVRFFLSILSLCQQSSSTPKHLHHLSSLSLSLPLPLCPLLHCISRHSSSPSHKD